MKDATLETWGLVLLRVLIGWHLCYEGIAKLWTDSWSAGPYLADSAGWFAGAFHALAANPVVLTAVDTVNVWALILIGAALILGLFTRAALLAGMVLLGLYFLSHPPLIAANYAAATEGNSLFVDKTLIEIAAMWVLWLHPTGRTVGLDRLIAARAG
jgi:thiosulfate dehydrogenase [quinone] large subunit